MASISKIVNNAIGGTSVSVFAAGALYVGAGFSYNFVADKQNGFSGTVQVDGKDVRYEGKRPYNPLIPFFNQDPNGSATIKFANYAPITAEDSDLTKPGLSLEDKIRIEIPGGQVIEFDNTGVYNDDGHYPFGEYRMVSDFLQGVFSEAQRVYGNVEEVIQAETGRK